MPRSNEVNGVDYHFEQRKILKNQSKEEFYEYAKILIIIMAQKKKQLMKLFKNDYLFDIDWQGTKQLSNFKI